MNAYVGWGGEPWARFSYPWNAYAVQFGNPGLICGLRVRRWRAEGAGAAGGVGGWPQFIRGEAPACGGGERRVSCHISRAGSTLGFASLYSYAFGSNISRGLHLGIRFTVFVFHIAGFHMPPAPLWDAPASLRRPPRPTRSLQRSSAC